MSEDTSQSEDPELFLQEMQGVKPLRTKNKVILAKSGQDKKNLSARRIAAEKHAEIKTAGFSSLIEVPQVGPHDNIGFKRPGIQDGVYRKLRLGRYEIEARLDLHRHTLEQASKEVTRFIVECMNHDIRTVLILPGKGDRGQAASAVLKSHLVHWLKDLDQVQAFHTAQPQHGGAGAFYVLLRSSERQKQLVREQFNKNRL